MLVAGIDLATAAGVCVGRPGQTPQFFTRDLGKGKSHDFRFAEAMRLARYLISDLDVEAIGIEAPIIVPKRDKKQNNELLMGLCANIRGWAKIKGIRCETLEIQHIDKVFLGCKQTEGRDARKRAIWTQCRMRGWKPETQDEADAASTWDTMCVHLSPSYAANSGLLLSRRYYP